MAPRVEDWGRDIAPLPLRQEVLHRDGPRKWVTECQAWRDRIPVTWTAIETVEPAGRADEPGSIRFYQYPRHGARHGRWRWWFKPRPERGDVLVGIRHELEANLAFPVSILGTVARPRIDRWRGLYRVYRGEDAASSIKELDGSAGHPRTS